MQKIQRVVAAATAAALSISAAQASQDYPDKRPAKGDLSGLHDFDPLIGEWTVHHWRLKERLAGSTEWVEFEGTSRLQPMMEGWGNVDDNWLDLPDGAYRAATLRTYDPVTGTWAIWWLDGRNPHGPLDPPVKGKFVDGVGTFYADDSLRGQPIKVRFVWSAITATTAHWEQAFSPDGGKTWEVNWRMAFTRRSN